MLSNPACFFIALYICRALFFSVNNSLEWYIIINVLKILCKITYKIVR